VVFNDDVNTINGKSTTIIDELSKKYKMDDQEYEDIEKGKIAVFHTNTDGIKETKKSIQEWLNLNCVKKVYISRNNKGVVEADISNEQYAISSMLVKYRTFITILVCLLLIIMIMGIILSNIRIVFQNNNECTIGIIDGRYTEKLDGVVYNTMPKEEAEKTHGDNMTEFAKNLAKNTKIYYYDATDQDGKVDTNNLLLGLEYMKKNDVTVINISLSSKKYSSEVQAWINNNPEIKVYASYNNLVNSIDYPAMYNNVIGCGKREKIQYKDIDHIYSNNKTIIFPDFASVYEGNSYLSLYDAILNK